MTRTEAFAVMAVVIFGAAALTAERPATASPQLPDLVTLKAVRQHQQQLSRIAVAGGGNRAAGLPGGEASVGYIAAQLRRFGYDPAVRRFSFNHWAESTPPAFQRVGTKPATYTPNTDFITLRYAGKGDVTAPAAAVDPKAAGTGSGCESGDFARFPRGAIALIARGGCPFSTMTDNAIAAGATAVVIYQRSDTPGPVLGSLQKPYAIPVIGPTHAIGTRLVREATSGRLRLRVRTDAVNEVRRSANVIADTKRGRADKVVVVGAHHDSVLDGPGINDNGSGTATLLAMAEQIGKLGRKLRNQVRFAFFGAEELGLRGSSHYVDHLSRPDRDRIALMLNFDMLGSPNHVRFVYDGDNSDDKRDKRRTTGKDKPGDGRSPSAPRTGSAEIEAVFNAYFAKRGLATEPTPLSGRSDYEPFRSVGIPVGGLFSGAEGVKTAREAKIYGGTAGKPYDPCYHKACDTYGNVNTTGLDQMADAAAAVTERFAVSGALPGSGHPRTA